MVSNITDVVADEIELWRNRPVDEVYPIVVTGQVPEQ
jgi:putative transposase